MLIELFAWVALVLCLSFMCSLFESVLYSVPESHIESLASAGNRSGILLKKLRAEVDRPITAVLTLNTIANTAGAAVTGVVAVEAFGQHWLGYFSAVFTFCVLIFSEIIPKTIGVRYARSLSTWVAHPLWWMVVVLTPVVLLCGLVTKGISRNTDSVGPSPDEIHVMARIGLKAGTIHKFEGEIIKNILKLDQKVAEELMTPLEQVLSLSAHMNLNDARKLASEWGVSRIPVYDMDQEDIVGILMQRDLFKATVDGRDEEIKISSLMGNVNYVTQSTNAEILFNEFIKRRQHLFVVLNEQGQMAGIITLEDILEEIVGEEIVDEFDSDKAVTQAAGTHKRVVIASK